MTFATPLLAGIAAAIAIPSLVILYFLKLRRRDVEVSTTLIWKMAVRDMQANAPFQKLRRNILLFLQLLALAAILFALAGPEWSGSNTDGGRRHIILIDRSASMLTRDAGDTPGDPAAAEARLEEAKRRAIELVDSLEAPGVVERMLSGATGAGASEAMVIAFDERAEVRQGFTNNKTALRSAIRAIEASHVPGSMGEAFELALAQSPMVEVEDVGFVPASGVGTTVHAFTDGRLPDTEDLVAQTGMEVIYHRAGQETTGNLAIVAVGAQRSFEDPGRVTIFASVQNSGREARRVDVQLSLEGQVRTVVSLEIGPATLAPATETTPAVWTPGVEGAVFRLEREGGGLVGLALLDPAGGDRIDALEVDNTARVIIPPARRLRAALVTRGNLLLQTAIESLPLASAPRVIAPGQFADAMAARELDDIDVFVIDGEIPVMRFEDGPDRPALPAGRFLVLGTAPESLGSLRRHDDGGVFVDWDQRHPALRDLSLSDVIVNEDVTFDIRDDAAATELATTQHGPSIVELVDGRTRAIVVAFDPNESNWPFRWEYVAFLGSAVRALITEAGANVGRQMSPGEVLATTLPRDATDVRALAPGADGETALTPTPDGRVTFGPAQETGVLTVTWSGGTAPGDALVEGRARRDIAVNLASTVESRVDAAPTLELASASVQAREAEGGARKRQLWPLLVVLALAVMMVEWFVFNKKVHL